jgi:hypothetical protein
MVEKVRRLLQLLGAMLSHPFLKERLALKGGTALNLFLWDVPRLSGHSSDRMTEHYSFVSDGEKQKALGQLFEKLGPGLADPMGMGTTPLVTKELESDA